MNYVIVPNLSYCVMWSDDSPYIILHANLRMSCVMVTFLNKTFQERCDEF
jgi:hypothetical protein